MSVAAFPDFAWSVGEEGSDPIVLKDGVPYRHDQFAQSGHYVHQQADLAAIADLGVEVVRYGMPWRLAESVPGRYDWTLWDRAIDACRHAGLEPIVDLLHFGLPDHFDGFRDPAWIEPFRDYATAFAERYSHVRWYTPINEPGITAFESGRTGRWNDRLASPEDHAVILANVVRANLEALTGIGQVSAEASWIGSEGFLAPVVPPDATDAHHAAVARRRALGWLVWDLHYGTEPLPEAADYLRPVDDDTRARIAELAYDGPTIAGHDVYPIAAHVVGGPPQAWSVEERIAICCAELARWSDRYHRPFWIAETSNLSLPVSEQVPWLEHLTAGLLDLRSAGHEVRGLCWYSRGDQFDWLTALAEPTGAVTEVGVFDVDRNPRPVAETFARLAREPLPAQDGHP